LIEVDVERSHSGTGIFSDSAMATVNAKAVGKRAAGSFARLRMITNVSADGTFGLM
jgi:hypothetical protein